MISKWFLWVHKKAIALRLCILCLLNSMNFIFYYNWFPVVSAASSKKTIIPTTSIDNWPLTLSLYFTTFSFPQSNLQN